MDCIDCLFWAPIVVAVALITVRALIGRCATRPVEEWREYLAPGHRVLVVASPNCGFSDIAKQVSESGAEIAQVIAPQDSPSPDEVFDVVIVGDVLKSLPAHVAKKVVRDVFDYVPEGGMVLVRNLSVLPCSLLPWLLHVSVEMICLAWRLATAADAAPQPPYDIALWMPRTANVEKRVEAGPLHEALCIRKVADPTAVVDNLRRLHGDTSMAYCTAPTANRVNNPEDDMRYFVAKRDGVEIGYVAYMDHVLLGARLRLVLMDPVCAVEHREATVRPFLEECDAVQARPLFSCVSADWREALFALGLSATMLGSEVGISLGDYKLSKERRRYIRAAPAKGLELHSECFDLQELEALNSTWVGSKASGTEVTIWTWPPSMPESEAGGDEEVKAGETKRLFTYQDGRLVGFVVAEPYYRGDGSGEVLGYGLNTIRFLPQLSPPWISDYTVASLVQSLKEEGKADYLAFGLSPFCQVEQRYGDIPWLRCLHQVAWKANLESIYSIQGLAKKKAHHCAGQGVPLHDRFVASPSTGLTAVGDASRFVLLLLGDNIAKVPEALASLGVTLSADLAVFCRQTLKSTWSLLKGLASLSWRRSAGSKSRRQGRSCTTTRRKTKKMSKFAACAEDTKVVNRNCKAQ